MHTILDLYTKSAHTCYAQQMNSDVIFIERFAHDIVSPLSSACFLAEILDHTLYQRLMDIINSTNLIKYTCQDQASYDDLSKFLVLFKNITFAYCFDAQCEYLKHLLLWLYFKSNKHTIITLDADITSVENIYISDEEYEMINNQNAESIDYTYHTVYLYRLLLSCKKNNIQMSVAQIENNIQISFNKH